MSVSISICNNHDYCNTNGLEKRTIEECYCVYNDAPDANCHFCHGVGKIEVADCPNSAEQRELRTKTSVAKVKLKEFIKTLDMNPKIKETLNSYVETALYNY